MIDLDLSQSSQDIFFYSNASANPELGFGAVFNNNWLFGQWEPGYIKPDQHEPTIEYLELYALTTGLLTWGHMIKNKRVTIFCDNMAVVFMINNQVSSCPNCMFLLRLITLNDMVFNRRTFTKYVKSADNCLSDALSHLQFNRFWSLVPQHMRTLPTPVSSLIWPPSLIWQK